MNRTVLKNIFLSALAAVFIVCAAVCVWFAYASSPSTQIAVADSPLLNGQNVRAATNSWTTTPEIKGNVDKNKPATNRYDYNCFVSLQGAAAQGETEFSVYAATDGTAATDPVNATLTGFVLTDGKVSAEVKAAMNALTVGSYILRASARADGYDVLSTDVEFTVSYLAKNGWISGGTPKLVGWAYGETPRQLSGGIPAAGTVRYVLQGYKVNNLPNGTQEFSTLEELNAVLTNEGDARLGDANAYRDYTLTLTVDGDRVNYESFTHEITFRIKRQIEPVGFSINSFNFGVGVNTTLGQKIDLNIDHSFYAELTNAVFSVIDANGDSVVQHSVFLRDDGAGTHAQTKKELAVKISKLDAGTYTLRQDIFEGETYGANSAQITFEILPVAVPGAWSNGASAWKTLPAFVNDAGDVIDGVWQYGQAAPRLRWGVNAVDHSNGSINIENEIVKSYYERVKDADGIDVKGKLIAQDIGGSTDNMPRDVGAYFVEFSLLENKNYYFRSEDVILLPFEITTADDPGFTTNPYAVGWTWGMFDKDVNLFGAIPTRGGAVSFSVLNGKGEVVNGIRDFTVDSQNVIVDNGGLADRLNKLDSGTYTLLVKVASSGNYRPFESSTTFQVAQAPNRWTTSPNIARWAQYYYKASVNAPKGVAEYGDVVMEVRARSGGELFYKSVNGRVETDNLANAQAGWYTFVAAVEETDNYGGLSYNIEFQVFSESVDMPNNHWVTVPTIESWIAGGAPSKPQGEALRGEVILTYYKAAISNGKYVPEGDALTQLPTDPGKYFMCARVRNASLPQDELLKHDVLFEIFERVNEWTTPPRINDYTLIEGPSAPVAEVLYKDDCVIEFTYRPLSGGTASTEPPMKEGVYVMTATARAKYCATLTAEVTFTVSLSQNEWTVPPSMQNYSLGDGPSAPVAEVLYKEDCVMEFKYYPKFGGEALNEPPTTPGVYVMTVTATAKHCEPLTANVEFTVSLSQNSWIIAPTIKDWAEEDVAGVPTGTAAVGSELIEYLYARADSPDVKFSQKPTTEGDYILYATLDVEGYELLTARWEFTIASAYDRTLVVFDIVMSVVCCVLVVVAIVFAVRRYRQIG